VLRVLSLLLLFLLGLILTSPSLAQETRSDEKGTFLGVLVSPNTDARAPYSTRGVRITQILPDSPAARAELHRDDVLLEYDGKTIRDGEHLAELIRHDKPERRIQLRFLRDAKEQTTEVTLTLGPPLILAPGTRKGGGEPSGDRPGTAKPSTTPASVCVVATPLEEGKWRLTVEYYATGKIQTVTCEGATEIANMVQKLPERERNLVRVALQRLRTIKSTAPNPGPPDRK
jgi:hypothetical protein